MVPVDWILMSNKKCIFEFLTHVCPLAPPMTVPDPVGPVLRPLHRTMPISCHNFVTDYPPATRSAAETVLPIHEAKNTVTAVLDANGGHFKDDWESKTVFTSTGWRTVSLYTLWLTFQGCFSSGRPEDVKVMPFVCCSILIYSLYFFSFPASLIVCLFLIGLIFYTISLVYWCVCMCVFL